MAFNNYGFDPVMSGFEQPMTMSPAGQLAAYAGGGDYTPPGVGVMAGADPLGGLGSLGAQSFTPGYVPPQPAPAGVPPIFPAIPAAAAAAGIALPAWLLAVLGIAGAGYAGYQALGGGEGGGIGGINVLGGDEFELGGLEFGGPGLPEPLAPYTERHVPIKGGRLQYYYIKQYSKSGKYAGMRIAMYNTVTKQWKVWRLPKSYLAVIGKNMPRHQMLVRLRKNLKRHTSDARTLLKITSPQSLAKPKHHHPHRKHYAHA